MGLRRVWPIAVVAVIAAGCTPGAQSAPAGAQQHVASAVTVAISLINYPDMSSAYGMVGGFNPAIVVVAHGTAIQFHNQDGFNHTASSIAGSSFPAGSPIPSSALTPSGSDVSQANWSSGLLPGGAYSRTFLTSSIGQYLFGCFYHYSSGMRGVIVVQ